MTQTIEPLIDTATLAGMLGRADLALFDATKYLPGEGRDGAAEFLRAHIPGARFFDIDQVADPDTDLPHMVPSAGRCTALLRGLGIGRESIVVFYDQKGIFSAPRGWWLLRLFGHDRVAVLDGGLPRWLAEGRATEAAAPPPATPGDFIATLRAGWLRGIGDMLENVASRREIVLDARGAARFAGQAPEPRPGLPAGHIPGSRNLPYTELLDAEGRLLAPTALRARFAAAGIDGSRMVITSCGSGVSAAILTLAMVRAGLPPGALYDGSWTEWAGRADTPKDSDTPKE